ncbi:MAG: hypothetical protein HZA50_04415 [Planctomycetes bacterium]|nr:hypothetical protein [Planctomycetota bacterium]
MKTDFFNSIHCASRLHCRTCRDREDGRKWREIIRGEFGNMDAGFESDFDCPRGLPWGFLDFALAKPNLKSEISNLKSLASRRTAENCRACEYFQGRRCMLYRGGRCTPCEFAAYLNQPNAICPAGKQFSDSSPAPQGDTGER